MRRTKSLFCLFLAVTCLFSTIGTAFGEPYGDYEYTYWTNNTVAISYFHGNTRKSTTIPSSIDGRTVTVIMRGSFALHPSLQAVTIPDNIITLEDEAFVNCTKLQQASIGAGVSDLPGNPFDGCIRLHTIKLSSSNKYLTLRDGVLYLKEGMKLRCYPAAKIGSTYVIPDGVTEIGDSAFSGASQLKTVVIPASVTSIHKFAFNDGHGNLQSITLDVTNNSYAKTYAIEKNMRYVDHSTSK